MRGIASLTPILVCITLWTPSALAQGQRNKFSTQLSRVTELHLETGSLSEAAQRCGLATSDLEAPARRALESSRLQLRSSGSNFVFANANVVMVGDVCTAAIDVELFRFANEFGASVSVWRHTALISGGRSGFNSRVQEKVDALTREFIADWQKARQ